MADPDLTRRLRNFPGRAFRYEDTVYEETEDGDLREQYLADVRAAADRIDQLEQQLAAVTDDGDAVSSEAVARVVAMSGIAAERDAALARLADLHTAIERVNAVHPLPWDSPQVPHHQMPSGDYCWRTVYDANGESVASELADEVADLIVAAAAVEHTQEGTGG